jgi:hypothetical protein
MRRYTLEMRVRLRTNRRYISRMNFSDVLERRYPLAEMPSRFVRESFGTPSTVRHSEEMLRIGWITGFVDGEGCFSINFIRQPDRPGRKGYSTGYQVAHEFAVVQGTKSVDCLHMMRDYFGVGEVYVNRRYDNHKENLQRYCVRKRSDLCRVIIPFFLAYPLSTGKKNDFLKFRQCMALIESNDHVTFDGLAQIVRIAETMNQCKPRTAILEHLAAKSRS